ncbi:MAG: 50S ribosomal protein L28 [Candidatus Saccharibacteria bacterium]|nr:50S ribosomal protein L28 [Candidatus Saccharibacteria bacterium]MCY4010815.1 50S ribosomal protein L28 [Candidatus Saccharibacteria bacterium]MCY4088968.1 50S ribosomal protein L28 [Candidatus Saccharibacteria bacterium]
MRKCDLSGKGKQHGHNVSFSLRRTPKIWKPNLHKKTLFINGQKVRLKISTHALRTLKKKNLLDQPPKKYVTKRKSSD